MLTPCRWVMRVSWSCSSRAPIPVIDQWQFMGFIRLCVIQQASVSILSGEEPHPCALRPGIYNHSWWVSQRTLALTSTSLHDFPLHALQPCILLQQPWEVLTERGVAWRRGCICNCVLANVLAWGTFVTWVLRSDCFNKSSPKMQI